MDVCFSTIQRRSVKSLYIHLVTPSLVLCSCIRLCYSAHQHEQQSHPASLIHTSFVAFLGFFGRVSLTSFFPFFSESSLYDVHCALGSHFKPSHLALFLLLFIVNIRGRSFLYPCISSLLELGLVWLFRTVSIFCTRAHNHQR